MKAVGPLEGLTPAQVDEIGREFKRLHDEGLESLGDERVRGTWDSQFRHRLAMSASAPAW